MARVLMAPRTQILGAGCHNWRTQILGATVSPGLSPELHYGPHYDPYCACYGLPRALPRAPLRLPIPFPELHCGSYYDPHCACYGLPRALPRAPLRLLLRSLLRMLRSIFPAPLRTQRSLLPWKEQLWAPLDAHSTSPPSGTARFQHASERFPNRSEFDISASQGAPRTPPNRSTRRNAQV